MNDTIGKRLKYARKIRGISQVELAKAANITQGTITNLETDNRQSSKHLLAMSRALNINPEWLESGKGPMEPQHELVKEAVPNYAATKNAEIPVINIEDAKAWPSIDIEVIGHIKTPNNKQYAFAVIAPDDTMASTNTFTPIPKGAIVAIDTDNATPDDGKLFLVKSHKYKQPIIRVMQQVAGQWELRPQNDKYTTYTAPFDIEKDTIIGKVVHISVTID